MYGRYKERVSGFKYRTNILLKILQNLKETILKFSNLDSFFIKNKEYKTSKPSQ